MKNKIKEVHDYFKNKITNGDYEVTKNNQYDMTIIVDGEYSFCLWMANDGINFGTYDGQHNFMDIKYLSAEITKKAYLKAKVHHDKYKRNELLEQKRKELEELENELSE